MGIIYLCSFLRSPSRNLRDVRHLTNRRTVLSSDDCCNTVYQPRAKTRCKKNSQNFVGHTKKRKGDSYIRGTQEACDQNVSICFCHFNFAEVKWLKQLWGVNGMGRFLSSSLLSALPVLFLGGWVGRGAFSENNTRQVVLSQYYMTKVERDSYGRWGEPAPPNQTLDQWRL